MWRYHALLQTTGLALGILTLSACQPDAQVTPNVKFTTPARILQARAVDKSQLRPSVRLSTDAPISMRNNGNNTWSGTIDVKPNSVYSVTVDWNETIPAGEFGRDVDEQLLLATWSNDVAVDADGAEVNLDREDYIYELDADGDTLSNIEEREDGTNPFVSNASTTGGDEGDDAGTGGETDTGTTTDATSTEGTDGITDSSGTTSEGSDEGSTAGSSTVTDGLTAGTTDVGETDGDSTTTGGSTGDNNSRASVLIPRIQPVEAPEIDGRNVLLSAQNTLTGEWFSAVQTDDSGEGLWIDRLMVDIDSNPDTAVNGDKFHRWAAMHDGEYLYVVVLSDDVGLHSSDSDLVWQDDALELFIDGNNSRLTQWGDADDFHYLIALQQKDSKLANNEISNRVTTESSATSERFEFSFSTGPGLGPDGIRMAGIEQDVYELAIPIAEAGITIGRPFGFELQIDDDDDGNGRDSKWGWFHESQQNGVDTDKTYQIPSVMGTLILEE